MAVFNPETNNRDPQQFLTYSKGIDVDTRGDSTLGSLFKGVGDLVSLGTKVVNEGIERDIKSQLEPQVDQVRAEAGVDAATTLQEKADASIVPGEIQRATEQLQRMGRAVQAGTLTDSAYWGRLNSISRQLRTKYPGHRDYIDQKMSSMVGTNPANALVRALRNEAEAAGNKAEQKASKEDALAEWGLKNGHIDATTFGAFRSRQIPFEKMVAIMDTSILNDKTIERARNRLGLKQSLDEAGKRDAGNAINEYAVKSIDAALDNVTEGIGLTHQKLDTMIQEAQARGGKPTPEQVTAINNHITMLETGIGKKFDAMFSTPGSKGQSLASANPEAVAKAKATVLARFDEMRKAVTDGNYGLISWQKKAYEATANDAKLAALQPEMGKRLFGLRNTVGDAAMWPVLARTPGVMTAAQQYVRGFGISGIVSGETQSLADAVKEVKRLSQDGSGDKVSASMAEATLQMIQDPKLKIEAKEKLINAFFGPANMRFLSGTKTNGEPIATQQERSRIFQKLANPKVVQEVYRLKQEGRDDLWQKMNSWVTEGILTYGNEPVTNLQTWMDAAKFHTVTYDKGKFTLVPKPLTSASDAPGARTENISMGHVVNTMNNYMSPFISMYSLDKKDPLPFLEDWMTKNGLKLDTMRVEKKEKKAGGSGDDRISQVLVPYEGATGSDSVKERDAEFRANLDKLSNKMMKSLKPEDFEAYRKATTEYQDWMRTQIK